MASKQIRRGLLKQKGSKSAVFIDGVRTPFVKSFGVFEDCDSLELLSRAMDGLLRKTELPPSEIDEVIAGTVIANGRNLNIARDAVLNNGLDPEIHAYTLNRACASSLQAIANATQTIQSGEGLMILAGGVECLSDMPIPYSKNAKRFLMSLSKTKTLAEKLNVFKGFSLKDWMPKAPGVVEPLTGYSMGEHAEMMAKINQISRQEQDALALASHHNAAEARDKTRDEIISIWAKPKYKVVHEDNIIRADTSLESLAKLRPAFDRKQGTITAGNASPLTDGAAMSLIADLGRAKELGLKPKTWIRDFVSVGVQPYPQLLLGPAVALPLILKRNQLTLEDIDLFEVHEAFAAQVLSCLKVMESKDFMAQHFGDDRAFGSIDRSKLNVNGGAISIGHPFGATGSRMATSLSNELIRRKARYGVIAICAAGGLSSAILLETYHD